MLKFYNKCSREGIEGVIFGDIFLEDLKDYRMGLLKPSKLFGVFPLWKLDSSMLVNDFINAGFRTTICSADSTLFSEHQLGSLLDQDFLDTLSSGVDPCGENGEFHTFVYDGPLFKRPINIVKGDKVRKTYSFRKIAANGELEKLESAFWFQDLI